MWKTRKRLKSLTFQVPLPRRLAWKRQGQALERLWKTQNALILKIKDLKNRLFFAGVENFSCQKTWKNTPFFVFLTLFSASLTKNV